MADRLEEKTESARRAIKQRDVQRVREERPLRDAVPFTGNTAGQPIASAPIPLNTGAPRSVLDGDKAALDAKAARDAAAAKQPPAKTAAKRR